MEINSRRPSWRCPYCNRNVSFPDLRLDLQMLKILKDCQDTAVDVMVSEDGSWETLKNEETSNTNVGTAQVGRKKDRSPNISGESSAEEGEIRLEKSNANYIELSDSEDQERQEHENACQSFAVVSIGGDGGKGFEDRKPDVSEIILAIPTSSTVVQMEAGRDGGPLTSSSIIAEPCVINCQSIDISVQSIPNEAVYTTLEGLAERQVSRPPIAIQALPAQTGSTSNFLTRARTSSQPNSPAHASSVVHPLPPSTGNHTNVNTRPLQVQLPSFVGIQDGQVLLNLGHNQQLQQDASEFLNNNLLSQNADSRDYRQRLIQHLQQQRTVTSQPIAQQPIVQQSVTRVSRDHPYYIGARNVNQVRTIERPQQASHQQIVRPDSPILVDNQFLQQARLLPQLQQQSHLNLGSIASSIPREETVSSGFSSVAEGVPMFNQSPGALGAMASSLRRQTSQNTRTLAAQYLQSSNNPLIVPNMNIATRDQRWPTSSVGESLQTDTSMLHLADHMQRRMRGSITSPRDGAVNSSLGFSAANLSWLHGVSSQPSRFSPGVPSSAWSNDILRQIDPNNGPGTNLQSIQTASTLVSDFDNWFDMQLDNYVHQQGLGDLGEARPG